jgi:hypothetical protein
MSVVSQELPVGQVLTVTVRVDDIIHPVRGDMVDHAFIVVTNAIHSIHKEHLPH